MWLWGANPWAHSSDLPTPGDSTPTVLARRHLSGHQALGASCRTTADGGLPSSHRPEDLARSSHRTQKKKNTGLRQVFYCDVNGRYSDLKESFYHNFWGHFIQDFGKFLLWRKDELWYMTWLTIKSPVFLLQKSVALLQLLNFSVRVCLFFWQLRYQQK